MTLVGLAYLLADLEVMDVTLGIQWWSVLFLLVGLHKLAHGIKGDQAPMAAGSGKKK